MLYIILLPLLRNVGNIPINLTTFELRNVETAQSIYFDSVVVDSGQRVIIAYGEGDSLSRLSFFEATNLSDSLLQDSSLVWIWQTEMFLGDSSALLLLFEGETQIDKLQYGSAVGRTAENGDSTHFALKRDGFQLAETSCLVRLPVCSLSQLSARRKVLHIISQYLQGDTCRYQ